MARRQRQLVSQLRQRELGIRGHGRIKTSERKYHWPLVAVPTITPR